MAGVKLIVIYPRPLDEAAFEKAYREEHMPLIEQETKGISRFVASKVVNSPQGKVATYRLAEVHFTSMDDLTRFIESEHGQKVAGHAARISTGGPPIVLICEEESFVYW